KRPGEQALGLARRFLDWWVAELKALVPRPLTREGRAGRSKLILQVEGADLACYRCEGDAAAEIARLPCEPWEDPDPALLATLRSQRQAGDPVIFRLPSDRVLRRSVTLPAAARENLREVLGFEMDRQTPFNLEDVYYDFQLLETHRQDGQLLADLVVAPRGTIDEWLRKIHQLGLTLAAVTVGEPPDEHNESCNEPRVNLLPSESAPKFGQGSFKRLNTGLALGVTMLAVVALSLPLLKMHDAAARLQAEVKAAQAEAEQVQSLREALDAEIRYVEIIVAKKQEKPPLIELMAEVARILPDDTWLNTMNLVSQKLNIRGESKTASQLIGSLESSPLLAEPAFVSSVIPNPVTGYERFQISMTLVPGG
ncbi:MAG: PilN domain-containing protein, partial [Gammaproteobacteria bacterium]|nr:PilN domain-containing protein [Gammaproteobacteria bacterium]